MSGLSGDSCIFPSLTLWPSSILFLIHFLVLHAAETSPGARVSLALLAPGSSGDTASLRVVGEAGHATGAVLFQPLGFTEHIVIIDALLDKEVEEWME